MPNVIFNEGESHFLSVYFQKEPEEFGPFYVGLGTGGILYNEDATLDDMVLREVVGTGYSRQLITRDDTVFGWELRGDTVVSPELSFINTGIECWDDIDFVFITLSPTGTELPKTLISAVSFDSTIMLKPGKTLKVMYRFKAATLFTQIQELICGKASIKGDAIILPIVALVNVLSTASATGNATSSGTGLVNGL